MPKKSNIVLKKRKICSCFKAKFNKNVKNIYFLRKKVSRGKKKKRFFCPKFGFETRPKCLIFYVWYKNVNIFIST